MITFRGTIEVNDSTIDYVGQWKDCYGNCYIDRFIQRGRIIIDKQLTGVGFTTYYLTNTENVILLSPRTKLINNKTSKLPGLFYFNREKDEKGNSIYSMPELIQKLDVYGQNCSANRIPMKFLCTYDSFVNLANILEENFDVDIDNHFRIVIDEAHALIKDIKLKQCRNKSILSDFLDRLFCYSNLLFISATPLKNYLEKIRVFQTYDVDYYEMKWDSARVINRIDHKCKGSKDAFDQIYKFYATHTDSPGRHYFDAIYGNHGTVDYSYEAVIFLNDIADIKRILNDYVRKNGLIDVHDITILCAETKENADTLKSVSKHLKYTHDIPQEGDPHTTWTFVTSTCFWGVDFCSRCASSFVIANYHVSSLSLDIASDIPQIAGRQRLKDNRFRDTLHIFFTNNVSTIDDAEYSECRKEKMNESKEQIGIWEDARPERKDRALANLNKLIAGDPNALYVSTVSGKPEIDELLLVAEDYSRDIISNHQYWFIRSRSNVNGIGFNKITERLKEDLLGVCSLKLTIDRIRIVHDYFFHCPDPDQQTEFFQMLRIEGFNDIAAYFSELELNRIAANGFDPSKMDNEIAFIRSGKDISSLVASKFESGKTYSKKEVKEGLQEIYDSLGLKKKAKATDLLDYIDCEEKKSNGSCAIHVK